VTPGSFIAALLVGMPSPASLPGNSRATACEP
jgi:hypothetical protein